MSLESTIEQLIVAVHALTDALDNARKFPPPAPAPRMPSSAEVANAVAALQPATVAEVAQAVAQAAPALISYEEKVQPLIRSKATKNRKAVITLLGEFGAATGADLKPEQYADFLAKLEAL